MDGPEQIDVIPLDDIDAGDRLRPVDEAHVLAIAASVAQIGLQQPIIVRPAQTGGYILVVGAHRLAAVKRLGHPNIAALVEDFTPDQARLAEIDENLMRRELSALDRAIFLAERKAVYERSYPEAAHGKKKDKRNQSAGKVAMLATLPSFSDDAAARTGLSARSIRRAVELFEALSPEVITALRLHPLADNAAQLAQLARLDTDAQGAVTRVITERGCLTVQAARLAAGLIAPADVTPARAVVDRLMVSVRRLDAQATLLFEADIRAWLAARDRERGDRKRRRATRPGTGEDA